MSAVDTQARQVSDYLAELIQQNEGLLAELEMALLDNRVDEIEIERIKIRIKKHRPLLRRGNRTQLRNANEVAGAIDFSKRALTVGPMRVLDPHTQAKIVDIAAERERRRGKREAAERGKLAAASGQ